jgi:biotin transporter BioY
MKGDMGKALGAGVLPFLPGDAVKAAVACLAFPAAWRLFPDNQA